MRSHLSHQIEFFLTGVILIFLGLWLLLKLIVNFNTWRKSGFIFFVIGITLFSLAAGVVFIIFGLT